jgi:hypothetical protein
VIPATQLFVIAFVRLSGPMSLAILRAGQQSELLSGYESFFDLVTSTGLAAVLFMMPLYVGPPSFVISDVVMITLYFSACALFVRFELNGAPSVYARNAYRCFSCAAHFPAVYSSVYAMITLAFA